MSEDDHAYDVAEAHRRIANLLRPGVIDAVDLAAGTVRVKFDDTWTSGPLKVFQLHAGLVSSWSPPVAGEQVLALSPSGVTEAGFVLRGLTSTAHPGASDRADLVRLLVASDGAADDYDLAEKLRTISVPAGGEVRVVVGSSTITVKDGQVIIAAEALDLGAEGGEPVARMGDHVRITAGSSAGDWPIVEGSDRVKSA